MKINLKLDSWTYSRLTEPFEMNELMFRTVFSPRKDGGVQEALVYVDARAVAERFNRVVGPENWTDAYSHITFRESVHHNYTDTGRFVTKWDRSLTPHHSVLSEHIYEGVICKLTVLGVTKSDAGAASNTDPIKGAFSDALKRAAVKFGVGAYLYDLKGLRAEFDGKGKMINPPQLPEFALPFERPDPKDSILKLISQVRSSELDSSKRLRAESIISNVMVMGQYSAGTPLVVIRAVYEELSSLLEGLDAGA